ncbi:DUF4365 domain-containing protein [Stutzerimonas nitrititolerans]|uniref:DUF4365 domain-containing protein n=1 Tax=Stutzerimonas nitrititolerans TaxID=2482751 RepID=UPI0028AD609C|nr:DUF4365 domain-containing protein [Stutzerimonas nitrititolerans]
MYKKRRSLNQIKEEISYQVLRDKLPETWVIHEYGPDYGIDCVIELFDYIDEERTMAETLGENFFVQLKASSSIEYCTRRSYPRGNVAKGSLNENKTEYIDIKVAKFQLEMSELLTVQSMGLAVPVLLILVDTNTRQAYFVCLNDYIDKVLEPEDARYFEKASKTIYIPTQNEILNQEESLTALRAYGKRSKMYGAFGMFHYQKKEIERGLGLAAFNSEEDIQNKIKMISRFVETAIRQDIWSGHEFWKPIAWSRTDLEDLKQNLDAGIDEEHQAHFLEHCNVHVWHKLTNLGNMYEELVREWYLPTFLAQLTSYPEPGVPVVLAKA